MVAGDGSVRAQSAEPELATAVQEGERDKDCVYDKTGSVVRLAKEKKGCSPHKLPGCALSSFPESRQSSATQAAAAAAVQQLLLYGNSFQPPETANGWNPQRVSK